MKLFNRVSTVLLLMLALAFSARAQTTTTSTTLSAAITTPSPGTPAATTLTVASATGFVAGTTSMFVDYELMDVQAVSGTTITVSRGRGGLIGTHASGSTVFVGPRGAASPFITSDRSGTCTSTDQTYLPQINPTSGNRFTCAGGRWRLIGTLADARPALVSGSGATVTLTAEQCGATVLFDRAAGIVYTLPTGALAGAGCYFDFVTTVTITSNAATVVTDAGTTFVTGTIELSTAGGASSGFQCNGTTHVRVTSNGTTTGGILGSVYRLTNLSTTLWAVSGVTVGSGVLATPCSV